MLGRRHDNPALLRSEVDGYLRELVAPLPTYQARAAINQAYVYEVSGFRYDCGEGVARLAEMILRRAFPSSPGADLAPPAAAQASRVGLTSAYWRDTNPLTWATANVDLFRGPDGVVRFGCHDRTFVVWPTTEFSYVASSGTPVTAYVGVLFRRRPPGLPSWASGGGSLGANFFAAYRAVGARDREYGAMYETQRAPWDRIKLLVEAMGFKLESYLGVVGTDAPEDVEIPAILNLHGMLR